MDSASKDKPVVNVARFLPGMAKSQPDGLAVRAPRGRTGSGAIRYDDYTFEELNREVDRRCREMTAAGIHRGTRALLMVRPGLDLIALVFGLFKIGAVPVLIDPGMGLRGFLRCVERSRPEALVAIPLGVAVSRIFQSTFRSVRSRVCVRPRARLSPSEVVEPFEMAATGAEDLAAILFTSGSTGPAKGVCYKHRMFEAQVELIREHYRIEPGEVDLPMLPVFALFNPALGMTTVVPEMNPSRPATVNPEKIVQAILQCEVTNSFGSPVLWKKIGRYCLDQKVQLPSLKRILMAGAPVPPQLVRDFGKVLPAGEIHTPYGATECLPVSSISGSEILRETQEATKRGRGTCVGRLLPGIEARILPAVEGPAGPELLDAALPSGEKGEIVVRGPVVTEAYDALPEATRQTKIENGETVWHRIGDIGYFDKAGRFWFCGRKAERVQTRSGTLYTDCCEAIFNQHPSVFRTALIGLGEAGAQEPAIVIQPERGHFPRGRRARETFEAELRELGAANPLTRDIRRFFFRKTLPVDVRHNAKIHRRTLAREYNRNRSRSG